MLEMLGLAVVVTTGAAVYGFTKPLGAFKRSALVLLCAFAAPLALGFALSSFANPAAGMGIFFIMIALTLLIGAAAACMALGAAARHGWNALRL
jgi:hypothetical protein